ncbi:MAG: hypothetical protein HS128_22065 [Ideonella sp.]|nr:hypothetical protein [Ideonella sp.]MCC7455689.1 hypothetical protein [Nitrospira sp.]
MSKHWIPALAAVVANLAVAAPPYPFVPSQLDDSALEALFWDCDARTTKEVLPMADGVVCVMAADELKQRRFGGEFAALHAWWQAHKVEEHARRGAAEPVAASALDLNDPALQTP